MFFIVALPRSRTSWMANFLTHGNAFCYHEALNGAHSVEEFKARMQIDYTHVGNSDSGLMFTPFQEWFPDAKTVIIERPIIDCATSLRKRLGSLPAQSYVRLCTAAKRMSWLEGLRIQFDDLNDRLEEIWQYCIGDGFDARRAELLKNMLIEPAEIYQDPVSFRTFIGDDLV